jgi:predicted DNA-binding transcriptional regulator YafY
MTRAGRVFQLLELLRGAEATTVGAAAEALGVTRRTILRDVAVLRDAGHPIVGEGGPGGGIRLEGERGVTAVHLAEDEVAALWLSAQLAASVTRLPWSGAGRAALDKLLASLPRERARAVRALVRRVRVGRPATARIVAELGPPPAELLGAFEAAFARKVCLAFDYRDRHGRETRRCVEPHGLMVEAPAWYVLARDTATGAARLFRMDRIRGARPVPSRGFAPDFEGVCREAFPGSRDRGDRGSRTLV